MREDHDRFTALGAHVVAIAPESLESSEQYLAKNPLPYPLVADESHSTFDSYDVISRLASLGQRPALFVVDAEGIVRFNLIGTQQWQIPTNDQVIAVLEGLRSDA